MDLKQGFYPNQILRIFERKVLRAIFGSVNKSGEWGTRFIRVVWHEEGRQHRVRPRLRWEDGMANYWEKCGKKQGHLAEDKERLWLKDCCATGCDLFFILTGS